MRQIIGMSLLVASQNFTTNKVFGANVTFIRLFSFMYRYYMHLERKKFTKIVFIHYTKAYSSHSGVGTHQRQEMREGKNKEVKGWKKKNWRAHRRGRTDGKKEDRTKKETGNELLRPAGIIQWAYSINSPGPKGDQKHLMNPKVWTLIKRNNLYFLP